MIISLPGRDARLFDEFANYRGVDVLQKGGNFAIRNDRVAIGNEPVDGNRAPG